MDIPKNTKKQNIIDRSFVFIESLPPSDRALFKGVLLVFVASVLWFVVSANAATVVEVPSRGGTLREGIIGTPRFINPILAVTTADQDLTALVYAGLMILGSDGTVVPDIAESVTVSEDGRTYSVLLKKNVTFNDNTPLTADDVLFTISRVQNPATKSPLRASWEGVTAQKMNDHELRFTLTEPYAPFMENLTLGILPKHIWEQATPEEFPFSQYNSEPIGAGPYKVDNISRNSSGIPESYQLVANNDYFKRAPRIARLILHFYPTEDTLIQALKEGTVHSAGGLAKASIDKLRATGTSFTLLTTPLPRTFTLFFNQNEKPLFRNDAVRKALGTVANRDAIVQEVLGGYGEAIASPIPPGFRIDTAPPENQSSVAALDKARELLRNDGWRINDKTNTWEKKIDGELTTLAFSIATANTPVFENTAKLLKSRFEELGVPVTIKQFEQSDLIQTVIRPRQYDALLFGAVVGRELDFFSFWHSSQRNDPGLNVALYANITTDTLLSSARAGRTFAERKELYQQFDKIITAEVPAIFLYVPFYTYVTPPDVHNVSLTGVARGSERFSAINEWYMEKDSVWPFFNIH